MRFRKNINHYFNKGFLLRFLFNLNIPRFAFNDNFALVSVAIMILKVFLFLILVNCVFSGANECYPLYVWAGATLLFSLPKLNDTYCTMNAVTRSDSLITINCTDLYLPENVHLQIFRNGVWKEYNDDFEITSDSLKIKLESFPGYYFDHSCNITSNVQDHRGLQVDNCRCGNKDFSSSAYLFDSYAYYCGATIISNRIALTAAHCVYNRNIKTIHNYVLFREQDFELFRKKEKKGLVKVAKFIIHDGYKQGSMNDIGLVVTKTSIEFNQRVGPACLPFAMKEELVWDGIYSTGLKKSLVPFELCQDNFILRHNSFLCLKSNQTDTCEVGTGGGIFYKNPNTGQNFIIGVITKWENCTRNFQNFHIKVDYFLSWMSSQIKFLSKKNFILKKF